jgi:hypothetical protein
MSSVLNNFNSTWFYVGGLTTENTQSGPGLAVYLAELGFGTGSGVGQVNVKYSASGCTLTEQSGSPYAGSSGSYVFSVGAFPPRPF